MSNSYESQNSQLEKWTSNFGDEYAERNTFEAWRLIPGTEAFRRMMSGRDVDSVLEVGCSVGLNLIFIKRYDGRVKLWQPNAYQTLLPAADTTRWRVELRCFHLPLADAAWTGVYGRCAYPHCSARPGEMKSCAWQKDMCSVQSIFRNAGGSPLSESYGVVVQARLRGVLSRPLSPSPMH